MDTTVAGKSFAIGSADEMPLDLIKVFHGKILRPRGVQPDVQIGRKGFVEQQPPLDRDRDIVKIEIQTFQVKTRGKEIRARPVHVYDIKVFVLKMVHGNGFWDLAQILPDPVRLLRPFDDLVFLIRVCIKERETVELQPFP